MAENDKDSPTVKVEIEVPKDQISIKEESQNEDDKGEKSEKDKSGKDKNDEDKSLVEKTTGYEAGELIKAPLSPPEAEASSRPARSQIRNLLAGFLIVIFSLVAWPIFGFRVAIAVALVGAAFIAFGTLVRI